jgi:endonuclease YncB( thermonuclease family)
VKYLLALCCCIALSARAETFTAKVIVVMDGDTVMVLREGGSKDAGSSQARGHQNTQKIKIRLDNIDAPEKDQDFGKQSRDSLLQMVGKKIVQIDSRAVDQYGRLVGLISVDGLNANEEQVRRGMAWAAGSWRQSRRVPIGVPLAGANSHSHSDETYRTLQGEARQAKRGLWAQNNPQAPWLWRKLHPSAMPGLQANPHSASAPAVPVMLYDMECGKKRRCSQMASCDEARFYFSRCGEKMLDGNHDGEPCESLCGAR